MSSSTPSPTPAGSAAVEPDRTGRLVNEPLRVRSDGLALLLLALVVGVLLWPLLLGRAPVPDYLSTFYPWSPLRAETAWNPLWFDSLGQYWPWRSLLAWGLRENHLPLWDPYQFNGYSFVGNGQSAVFYPLNWFCFGLFSIGRGFAVNALLHLFLAAAGSYWLVRELGASRSAALTAGLVFGLSGFMVTWLTLPTLVASSAWLPVALACLERARQRRSVGWGGLAGLALGLSALAGHPQMFYYAVVALFVIGALRLLPRHWQSFLAALVVAGLVSSLALLPVLEAAPRGHRPPSQSAEGYQSFKSRAVPVDHLITLFEPSFYGTPALGTVDPQRPARGVAEGRYWGQDRRGAISPGDYSEFNLYVGVTGLLLLLVALLCGGAAERIYAGVGLLALLLALGLPLNRLCYFALPGWSAGAGPCRLAMVWSLGAAVAAGLGLDRLRRASPRQLAAPAALWVGWLILAWMLARVLLSRQPVGALLGVALFAQLKGLVLAVLLVIGLVLTARRWPAAGAVLVGLDLLVAGWGFTPTTRAAQLDAPPPSLEMMVNPGEHDRIAVLDPPSAWGFYHQPQGLLLPPNLATAARCRALGGYDSILPAAHKQWLAELHGGGQPCPAINGNLLLLGGLQITPETGVKYVLSRRPMPAGWTSDPSELVWTAPAGYGRLSDGATFVVDGFNEVAVQTTQWPLTLRDSSYPGWWVYLGDEPGRPIGPSSPRCRVVDGSGKQLVRWVYQPLTVRLGLFLALFGLGLVMALWRTSAPAPAQRSGAATLNA